MPKLVRKLLKRINKKLSYTTVRARDHSLHTPMQQRVRDLKADSLNKVLIDSTRRTTSRADPLKCPTGPFHKEKVLYQSQAREPHQLKYSPKSTKTKSGPPFKSSIPFCTTKSKNNHLWGTPKEKDSFVKNSTSRSWPKRIVQMRRKMKQIYMIKCKKSTESSLNKEKPTRLMRYAKRSWMIRTSATNNSSKKRGESVMMKKQLLMRKLPTSTDLDPSLRPKERCNWKRENRRRNICRKCFWRTKKTRGDKRSLTRSNAFKIWGPKKNTPKCSRNKRLTESRRWKTERLVLKNSWTRWPIMYLPKWIKSNNWKTWCLPDMKTRGKWDKDNWRIEEPRNKKRSNRRWDHSLLSRSPTRIREKRRTETTLTSKLRCGNSINKIGMMKRKG